MRTSKWLLVPVIVAAFGAGYQVSEPADWRVSEEPTMQQEVQEGKRVLVDPLGYVWVHSFSITIRRGGVRVGDEGYEDRSNIPVAPGPSREYWTAYDSAGRKISTLEMPWDISAQAIGEDFIVATWTDEAGTKYVRRYSLDRGNLR